MECKYCTLHIDFAKNNLIIGQMKTHNEFLLSKGKEWKNKYERAKENNIKLLRRINKLKSGGN